MHNKTFYFFTVVVFLKPIDDLVTMELPITKDEIDNVNFNFTKKKFLNYFLLKSFLFYTQAIVTNNNDKEVLYDGITSTSIFVGKNAPSLDGEGKCKQTQYL